MSVPNSATRQPAPYSPLRGLVARHPAVAFLVLAFGFGWTSLIPILLSENGFGVLPIELPLTVVQTLATVLGLALPAFLVTAATGGKESVRDLLGRLLRWQVGLHWYLLVLFGLPVGVLLSAIVLHGAAPLGALARNWGCSSPRSCRASWCPSCTPTCGRRPDGRASCSQRCRTGAGPCLRA